MIAGKYILSPYLRSQISEIFCFFTMEKKQGSLSNHSLLIDKFVTVYLGVTRT